MPETTPPSFDHMVETYGLTILEGGLDFALENGDLALTKDGDIKLGDTVGSAMHRLVQAWRLNAPHLRHLFDLSAAMEKRRHELDTKLDQLGQAQRAAFDIRTFPRPNPDFVVAFHQINDEQDSAVYGHATYAGCACMVISGTLLRFKDDIEASDADWQAAGPLFNGCSVGRIVVAAANGFRHEDEWAKTRHATPQQRVSQEILARAVGDEPNKGRWSGGRCPQVLNLLSDGGDFNYLTKAVFEFAHDVAIRRRTGD